MTRIRPMTQTTRTPRAVRAFAIALALAVLTATALTIGGCSGGGSAPVTPRSTATPRAVFPATITDDSSHSVTVKSEPARIVSLAPANTEILFALGLGKKVVGVTSYDDYPSQVASIAKVGDFSGPNVEAVAAAKPDLILATSGVQADVAKKLEDLGATVVVFDPQSLNGVYSAIQRTGKITGATRPATELVARMKADVETARTSVSPPKQTEQRGGKTVTVNGFVPEAPSAFIEIGQNPLFTAGKGTLMDELMTLAGARNVVTQTGYVSYSAEQVIKANPEVYFATKGSSSDPATIEKRPGYSAIAAVKNKRVIILDDSLVSRGGPRIVDGLKAIADGLRSSTATGQP